MGVVFGNHETNLLELLTWAFNVNVVVHSLQLDIASYPKTLQPATLRKHGTSNRPVVCWEQVKATQDMGSAT